MAEKTKLKSGHVALEEGQKVYHGGKCYRGQCPEEILKPKKQDTNRQKAEKPSNTPAATDKGSGGDSGK